MKHYPEAQCGYSNDVCVGVGNFPQYAKIACHGDNDFFRLPIKFQGIIQQTQFIDLGSIQTSLCLQMYDPFIANGFFDAYSKLNGKGTKQVACYLSDSTQKPGILMPTPQLSVFSPSAIQVLPTTVIPTDDPQLVQIQSQLAALRTGILKLHDNLKNITFGINTDLNKIMNGLRFSFDKINLDLDTVSGKLLDTLNLTALRLQQLLNLRIIDINTNFKVTIEDINRNIRELASKLNAKGSVLQSACTGFKIQARRISGAYRLQVTVADGEFAAVRDAQGDPINQQVQGITWVIQGKQNVEQIQVWLIIQYNIATRQWKGAVFYTTDGGDTFEGHQTVPKAHIQKKLLGTISYKDRVASVNQTECSPVDFTDGTDNQIPGSQNTYVLVYQNGSGTKKWVKLNECG